MFLKLRLIFTVLACLCLAVVLPAGVRGGFLWFGIFAGGALLFFMLMLLCKQEQEKREVQEKKEEERDFLSPADKKEK